MNTLLLTELNNTINLIYQTNISYNEYIEKFQSQWNEQEKKIAYEMIGFMSLTLISLENFKENPLSNAFSITDLISYNLIYNRLNLITQQLLNNDDK
jgi:hypothetical protein